MFNPPSCPTVSFVGAAAMGDWLFIEIDAGIKEKIADPGSYERGAAKGLGCSATERADGSVYYRMVSVEFRNRNELGGIQRSSATIELDEDEAQRCRI